MKDLKLRDIQLLVGKCRKVAIVEETASNESPLMTQNLGVPFFRTSALMRKISGSHVYFLPAGSRIEQYIAKEKTVLLPAVWTASWDYWNQCSVLSGKVVGGAY